jgi:chromate transporter
MREYVDLIWTFFKMGCLTFGGGYAMLPLLERELVYRKKWVTMDEVMDYFVIGQVTPGIIAVNVSTFIGYKRKGIPGGVLATLGFVFPSLIIITLIAAFLSSFAEFPVVRHAFGGIRVAVGALILDAVIKLYQRGIKDLKSLLPCAAAFFLSVIFKVSPVFMIIAAGIFGFLFFRPKKPPYPDAASGSGSPPGEGGLP